MILRVTRNFPADKRWQGGDDTLLIKLYLGNDKRGKPAAELIDLPPESLVIYNPSYLLERMPFTYIFQHIFRIFHRYPIFPFVADNAVVGSFYRKKT